MAPCGKCLSHSLVIDTIFCRTPDACTLIRMFFIGAGADARTDEHEGYVAGRYRDGSRSDIWTDVTRCAERSFISYLPACECGWTGSDQPYSEAGFRQCQHDWVTQHFAPEVFPSVRRPVTSGASTELSGVDFDFKLRHRFA